MSKQEVLPVPSESVEQQHLFLWARMMSGAHPELQLMYKIPNDGRRTRVNGAHMVAEGLKKGVPDICLPVARGGHHGLYIELKRERGGKVSQEQIAWIEALKNEGYVAAVCRGCDEAISLITGYLAGR